ncbi:putative omega-3 fatty acid desaturase, chloroplastic-like [Capsicum annuum]|nr:putative omega-3 fatty acid desaturase, chloroplastic-like [Capsicum annuum]
MVDDGCAVDSGGGVEFCPRDTGFQFSVIKSPVCILKFVAVGARLVAGFESGQVAMLDVSSASVLFITDCLSSSSSRITSVAVKTLGDALEDTMEHCEEGRTNPYVKEVISVLTRDADVVLLDGSTGRKISFQAKHPKEMSTAISLYGITSVSEESQKHSSMLDSAVQPEDLMQKGFLGELSLTSILGWNSKINMDKTISSPGKAMISLVNGSEFAVISLLAFGNDFRIPEALPSLHKKSLMTAAADVSISQQQKKKQNFTNNIFGGIVKGLKGFKEQHAADYVNAQDALVFHLENIFCRFPFSDPTNVADDLGSLELKSLEGGPSDVKPILRTREEIVAKYRNKGDAAFAAAQAKDKLVERREKLEIPLGKCDAMNSRLDKMIDRLSFPTSTFPNPPNLQAPLSGHAPNELQGNKANSCTLVNEASSQLSVNDSLSLGKPNVSLLHDDNVQLEIVDLLVDPNDDKIDSSSKINLCPPMCESSPSLGNVYEVFKGPQVIGDIEKVGRLNGSDPLIVFVVDHASIEEDEPTMGEVVGTTPYDGKSFLEISNLLERPKLCKERASNKVECYRGVMSILRLGIHCVCLSPTVLQGLDSRTNHFQEGEDDTSQKGLKAFGYIFQGQYKEDHAMIKPRAQGCIRWTFFRFLSPQCRVWIIAWRA